MARGESKQDVKEEIRRARAALRNDVAALDHKLHVDMPRQVREQGTRAAIGLAAVGLALAGVALFGRTRRERAAQKAEPAAKKRRKTKR